MCIKNVHRAHDITTELQSLDKFTKVMERASIKALIVKDLATEDKRAVSQIRGEFWQQPLLSAIEERKSFLWDELRKLSSQDEDEDEEPETEDPENGGSQEEHEPDTDKGDDNDDLEPGEGDATVPGANEMEDAE